jgi:transposase
MRDKEEVVFVELNVSMDTLAVSVSGKGRDGGIRDCGRVSTVPNSVERLLKKLASRFERVEICYEPGRTGYWLCGQISAYVSCCSIVAPSPIPMSASERIKTDRRDAERLLRPPRTGELAPVWVPDETHEAILDLVRARERAAEGQRNKRQLNFAKLLRH